jgi:multisubunit Na+/H+ antiporter MnhB subunit
MNPTVQGLLIGLAVALFLLAVDYLHLRKGAHERAKRLHVAPKFDETERRRMASVMRFCLFVPPAFAIFFWLLWG